MVIFKYRIPYKYGDIIKLIPLFDIHIGNKCCDVSALRRFIQENNNKHTYWILGGDQLDNIIVTDPRYRKSLDATEREEIVDEQIEMLYEILKPIKDRIIGIGCLSADTLILTDSGWKYYNEINVNNKVLSLNVENDILEYKSINNIFIYDYDGYLHNLKSIVQNQLVTPEHNVLFRKRDDYKTKKPKILNNYYYNIPKKLPKRCYIPMSALYKEGNENINPYMVKIIGWIISEGSFLKGRNGDGIYIYQTENNETNINEIKECLDKLNFDYSIELKRYKNRRTNENNWVAIYKDKRCKRNPRNY